MNYLQTLAYIGGFVSADNEHREDHSKQAAAKTESDIQGLSKIIAAGAFSENLPQQKYHADKN